MDLKEKIQQFIDKGGKTAQVLQLLMSKPYVTCSEIINYKCQGKPIVFTTSPHKLIERIRRAFGYDFVKDEICKYQYQYTVDGVSKTATEHYKRYFLNYEGIV